jgi:hypothetical protein
MKIMKILFLLVPFLEMLFEGFLKKTQTARKVSDLLDLKLKSLHIVEDGHKISICITILY